MSFRNKREPAGWTRWRDRLGFSLAHARMLSRLPVQRDGDVMHGNRRVSGLLSCLRR